MTQTQTQISTTPDTCVRHRGNDRSLAVITTASAGLAYLAWHVGGVHLTVRSRPEVGLVSVLVTAAAVAVAGLALLRLLERRDGNALRTWTILACLIWSVSLLGPLGATNVSSALALLSLHAVVGSSVVVGARRMCRRGVA